MAKYFKNFAKLRDVCDTGVHGMHLGIGTIRDAATARTFIDTGADYIVVWFGRRCDTCCR